MLRIVFFGQEIDILTELQSLGQIEGVYFRPPALTPWKPRPLLLRTYRQRRLLHSLLRKRKSYDRKWHRIFKAFQVYDYARAQGLNVIMGKTIRDPRVVEQLEAIQPDLGVVANFRERIPKAVFETAKYGFINYHPSLLPSYRGPTPFEHVLLNEEVETGVTFHRIVEKFDEGAILAQQKVTISETDSIEDLMKRSTQTGRQLLGRLLESIENETVHEVVQDESIASYHGRLTIEENKKLERILEKRRQGFSAYQS